ncbi:MAG: T9SS type A sorting domain-containing protein, partial [Bacteroidota bacterium]
TDGGALWTSQTSGTTNSLLSVSFTDANTGTAVGYAGTILRTTNGGALWTSQTSGTTNELMGVSFTDANTGTAVGGWGTILRTTTGGVVWVNDDQTEMPKRFLLEQNYPNPFNPVTTIEYHIPVSSHVLLKVFDLLGREVATLVNEAKAVGVHTVHFDASGLAGGVYFYRISVSPSVTRDLVPTSRDGQAGNYVEARKLVLLR